MKRGQATEHLVNILLPLIFFLGLLALVAYIIFSHRGAP